MSNCLWSEIIKRPIWVSHKEGSDIGYGSPPMNEEYLGIRLPSPVLETDMPDSVFLKGYSSYRQFAGLLGEEAMTLERYANYQRSVRIPLNRFMDKWIKSRDGCYRQPEESTVSQQVHRILLGRFSNE